jgi:16S rRNA (cytidine1402-2'-O)-methyltransferase
MSLCLIATPIGNPGDISLRAIETLKESDLIIGEEKRELMPFLKAHGLEKREVDFLNEHSRPGDVENFVELCKTKKVCLVSDCGTPGFCDPGADLVAACRKAGVEIHAVPGASSLMTLVSLAGMKLSSFVFLGFLPAESEQRKKALDDLKRERRAVVLMDTPYRLSKLLGELSEAASNRRVVLGCDLTKPSQVVLEGPINVVKNKIGDLKAEFILVLAPL